MNFDIFKILGVKLQMNEKISSTIMEDLLQFMYLGEICVHKDNVRLLIAASEYLQMSNLKDLVCRFYEKKLCASNCLSISALADEFDCKSLKKSADSFIFKHFQDVSHSEEFKCLKLDQVIHIVKSEKLNVKREEHVFEAILGWIDHDADYRTQYSFKLLQNVRLPLISKYYLFDRIANNVHIIQNAACQELVLKAINFQCLNDRRPIISNAQTFPRLSHDLTEIIVACGGLQDELSTKDALCYVPDVDFWYPLAPLHCERNNFAFVPLDDRIYAIGGESEGKPLRSVEFYDFGLDKWTESANLPDPLSGHGAAVLNGEIYVVGSGRLGLCSDVVLKYDKGANRWVNVQKMRVPRRGACVVSHLQLYAIGGYGPSGMALASVERYDPYVGEWAKIFPMNSSRAFASGAVVGDKIFVIGGEYAMWSFYCSGEFFDVNHDEWHSIADASIPRSFTGIAVLSNCIYLFGGIKSLNPCDDDEFVDASECSDVEMYDPLNNIWKMSCPMPIPTAGIKCISMFVPKHAVEVRCGHHLPQIA